MIHIKKSFLIVIKQHPKLLENNCNHYSIYDIFEPNQFKVYTILSTYNSIILSLADQKKFKIDKLKNHLAISSAPCSP